MNKTELITAVATKTGKSKKDVETVITSLIETIVETVSNEEKVHLVGFELLRVIIVKKEKAVTQELVNALLYLPQKFQHLNSENVLKML